MSDRQFNTLLRLIADLGDKIDVRFEEYDKKVEAKLVKAFADYDKKAETRLINAFSEYDEKQQAMHFTVMKALEEPFVDHERRITSLEARVF